MSFAICRLLPLHLMTGLRDFCALVFIMRGILRVMDFFANHMVSGVIRYRYGAEKRNAEFLGYKSSCNAYRDVNEFNVSETFLDPSRNTYETSKEQQYSLEGTSVPYERTEKRVFKEVHGHTVF